MNAKKYSAEFFVGIFVAIGLLCVAYLTIQLGKMEFFSQKGYTVIAKFSSTTGLKAGANVVIAGVGVGKVTQISLDEDFYSNVHMRLDPSIKISDDTGAAIKTSGLIGDKYISLSPGGASDLLGDGDVLTETQSSIDIEDLISKYVFGSVK